MNPTIVNFLDKKMNFIELRILTYIDCDEKIKKITNILNFFNNNNFLPRLTTLYKDGAVRAENVDEFKNIPSLSIDFKDGKFRFKYWNGATTEWYYHLDNLFRAMEDGKQNFQQLFDKYLDVTKICFELHSEYKDDVNNITYEYYPEGRECDILYHFTFYSDSSGIDGIIMQQLNQRLKKLGDISDLKFEIDHSFKDKCLACEKARKEREQNENEN